MGIRFGKRIKICDGVNLNLSSKGIGLSAGVKGLRISTGPTGENNYLNTRNRHFL